MRIPLEHRRRRQGEPGGEVVWPVERRRRLGAPETVNLQISRGREGREGVEEGGGVGGVGAASARTRQNLAQNTARPGWKRASTSQSP